MNETKTHDTMNPETQRIAIAEACGWRGIKPSHGRAPEPYGYAPDGRKGEAEDLPDYLNDLNACHEFERILSTTPIYMQKHAFNNYAAMLCEMCKHEYNAIAATAPQRCEAFLKTINKWKDENDR